MKQKHALSFVGAGLLFLGLAGVALAYPHHHHHAPEIDPGSLGSGMALLVGSVLLVVERYRRRKGQ